MKLIILNGASCSGKSSIIKNIMKKSENLFYLSYDSLKWLFSDYKSDKHHKDVEKIFMSVAQSVFKMKYNIISDSNIHKIEREELINLAKEEDYEIVEINLETDYETLSHRFDKRVESALQNPDRKISNISKHKFKEIFDLFNKDKNQRAITFQTDKESIEEISENIIKFLK